MAHRPPTSLPSPITGHPTVARQRSHVCFLVCTDAEGKQWVRPTPLGQSLELELDDELDVELDDESLDVDDELDESLELLSLELDDEPEDELDDPPRLSFL